MQYVRGEIIVIFRKEVTKDEAKSFASSYGLTVKNTTLNKGFNRDSGKIGMVLIEVPEGTEYIWSKKLIKDGRLRMVSVNHIHNIL